MVWSAMSRDKDPGSPEIGQVTQGGRLMNPAKRQRAITCASALFLMAGVMAACGDDDTTTTTVAEPQDFSRRGPHVVGVTELQIDDERAVAVYYPAADDKVDDTTPFRITAEDHWEHLADLLPPDFLAFYEYDVPDTWVEPPAHPGGPFPVVVFNHPVATTHWAYSHHASHLASWGYVMAVPRHPTRDVFTRLENRADLTPDLDTIFATLDLLEEENDRVGGLLEGVLDDERVAVEGHSVGADEATLAASDDRVDAWIALAPIAPVAAEAAGDHIIPVEAKDGFDTSAGEFDLDEYLVAAEPPPAKPSLILAAGDDFLVQVTTYDAVYEWLPAPKRYVRVAGTGHVVFTDMCAGVQARAEPQLFSELLGLDARTAREAIDGCMPENTPVDEVHALWNHLDIAQLNWVFGIDGDVAEASLERAYLDRQFPGTIEQYLGEPAPG
jgi:predicted dienelactone hydrolase